MGARDSLCSGNHRPQSDCVESHCITFALCLSICLSVCPSAELGAYHFATSTAAFLFFCAYSSMLAVHRSSLSLSMASFQSRQMESSEYCNGTESLGATRPLAPFKFMHRRPVWPGHYESCLCGHALLLLLFIIIHIQVLRGVR